MGLISDIYNFFETAAAHPAIGHAPAATPPVKRFYGYNFEEFEAQKSNTEFFPCMGLSDSPHSGLSGTMSSGLEDTSVTDMLTVNVMILDIFTLGKYADEKDLYDRLKLVVNDLILYIHAKVSLGCDYDYEYRFIDTIDLGSISYARVGPKGTAKAFGWKISMSFRSRSINSDANPLNTILG